MKIKILLSNCCGSHGKRDASIEDNVNQALEELKLSADVQRIYDFQEIWKYGVNQPPALVIEEKVVFKGGIPSVEDIRKILSNY